MLMLKGKQKPVLDKEVSMERRLLPDIAQSLYEKMFEERYSDESLNTAQWIIQHFHNYCVNQKLENVEIPNAANFVRDNFGFDYYNTTTDTQKAVLRPLLILFEFAECGYFLRIHQKPAYIELPEVFTNLFLSYREEINTLNLAKSSQRRKLDQFKRHFKFLADNGIEDPADITFECVYDYFNCMNNEYSKQTIASIQSMIRDIYNWLYDNKYIHFSGNAVLPYIKRNPRDKLISYYSKEEIDQLLSCIDTNTNYGKCVYAVISILAHLGLRAGDVIRLKFSNIDWIHNRIEIVQQKTDNPLSLPLVEEVKYPLIDYIKNARPDSIDKDYIFITINAPYLRYKSSSAIHRMVTESMRIAGIEFEGRHHGPHALRHSLATSLMNENVPLSAISSILGHQSTMATEVYLTVDETHLKELSLEVPHE